MAQNVILFALLIMAITSIPYLVGLSAQRDGWQFGGFMFGAEDGNSYLAKMREGAQGGWLFHLAYTSEQHDGAYLFTPYLAMGKLAALFMNGGVDNPALVPAMLILFHIARIAFGLLAILVSYRFVALFVPRGTMRWAAITLICMGGGLGWLLLLIGQGNLLGSAPVDFYLPEGYTFFVLYGLPHLALARAALLGGFMLIFASLHVEAPGRLPIRALCAGVCWLVMSLCVPFYAAMLYALLGAWGLAALLRTRRFPTRLFVRSVIGALIPLPLLVYNLIIFAANPVMAFFSRQNSLPSPNPIHYVFGFGVLAIPALPGLIWAWRRGKTHTAYLLLPAWVIAAPLLAYLPVSVQRRLLEGVFVPLCILAVIGLRFVIAPRLHVRRRPTRLIWRQGVALLMALVLPSTLVLLISGLFGVAHPSWPTFHPAGEIAALDWLNAHAAPGSIVLSSVPTGNYLPARTNLRAFVGHGPETLDFSDKRTLSNQFFAGQVTLADVQNAPPLTLPKDPIRYVFYGPQEAAGHPPDTPPGMGWANGLIQIYAQGDYSIYRAP